MFVLQCLANTITLRREERRKKRAQEDLEREEREEREKKYGRTSDDYSRYAAYPYPQTEQENWYIFLIKNIFRPSASARRAVAATEEAAPPVRESEATSSSLFSYELDSAPKSSLIKLEKKEEEEEEEQVKLEEGA